MRSLLRVQVHWIGILIITVNTNGLSLVRADCGTRLLDAAASGALDQIKLLISQGANVNAKDERGCATPLDVAINKGKREMVELLLTHGADAKGKDEFLPLCRAAQDGHRDIAELLLARGANVNGEKNNCGPLAEAVSHGHEAVAALLIDHGARINWCIKGECYTPSLEKASEYGYTSIVELLLAHGAIVSPKVGGETPLQKAALRNHKEIVTLLRQKGAKESSFPPKETREIQRMLKFLGYEPDPFDGIAGDATVAAVKSFQQSNSLTPDGEFSVELKKSLEESLLKSTGPKSIEQLIAILGLDPYSYYGIQKYAIDALVSVGSPAVGQLVVLLKDKDPEVRKQSIRVLHEIKGERVIDPLIIVLKQEPDSAVRLAAAATLGVTKDPRTIEPLIAVLKQDKDSSVRSAAADALGEIKDRRAIDPLIAALRQDKDSSVRGAAAGALGKIKDHQAIDPLTTVLNTDSEVRENAIFALRDIGDKRAITPLLQYLTDWSVSKATAEALIGLGWEPQSERDRIRLLVAQRKGQDLRGRWELTKKVLLNEVETEDYRVIENALFAFIGIGRAEILPELVKKLEAKGNKTMAEAFLNCGHPELNKVARRWAKTHGYVVRAGTGASPVDWGEM